MSNTLGKEEDVLQGLEALPDQDHAHHHGSTFLQASSCAFGLIVIHTTGMGIGMVPKKGRACIPPGGSIH